MTAPSLPAILCQCGACNVCGMIDATVNGPTPRTTQQPEQGVEIQHPAEPQPRPKPATATAPTLFDGVDA